VPTQIGCNFQGLSKETKRCLITGTPDTELLDVDWSKQELCLQVSPKLYNDSGFRKVILEGGSILTCRSLVLCSPVCWSPLATPTMASRSGQRRDRPSVSRRTLDSATAAAFNP